MSQGCVLIPHCASISHEIGGTTLSWKALPLGMANPRCLDLRIANGIVLFEKSCPGAISPTRFGHSGFASKFEIECEQKAALNKRSTTTTTFAVECNVTHFYAIPRANLFQVEAQPYTCWHNFPWGRRACAAVTTCHCTTWCSMLSTCNRTYLDTFINFFCGFFGNGIRSSTNHVHRFFLIDASFLFGTFKHVSFFGYIFSTSIELEAFAQSASDRNLKLNWPGSLFSTCFPQLIIEVIVAKKWPQTSGWVCNFTCCCFKWPKLYMPRCRTVAQPLTT